MSPRIDAYAAARAAFTWDVPKFFNIGVDVTDKWAQADPGRVAIIESKAEGVTRTTFGQLSMLSNRLSNLLIARGLRRGDRVAVLAPQRLETIVAHAAIYKVGAIALPLFSLFGPDALQHRLMDSGATFLIADSPGLAKVDSITQSLPDLRSRLCMDDASAGEAGWGQLIQHSAAFQAVMTAADDPALLIYTSGTTGPSKGALHAHRVLLGHLPGVEMSHGGFPQEEDCMWTPADWAWIGGLLDVLLPALHHGVPVVAKRFEKFSAAAAFQLIQDCGIRNVFMPPTALKMLREIDRPLKQWKLSLRSIASGGESLGKELLRWSTEELHTPINEFYGQTECNMVVSSCSEWFPALPGAIGKAAPGHDVAIVDDDGNTLAHGEEGHIAIRSPDPVMFLGYWRNEEATRRKYIGDWLITGDRGSLTDEGFVHFLGRSDDIINSAGYRIGPAEIEDCLLKHPAVSSAGVVGVPDAQRTEIVVAFVIVREGIVRSEALAAQLQEHVRSRLGSHQYPRKVQFIDQLPLTVTGKVIRRALRDLASQSTAS